MPIYEYCCEECRQMFEEWQSGFEEKELECPVCGGVSRRVISNTTFHLKGGGWYATEYGNKSGASCEATSPAKAEATTTTSADSTASCASGSCPGQASSGSE